jgi:hypothetical protein
MPDKQLTTVSFTASFGKLVTCKDGGIKLTLDVPETDMMNATELMQYSQKILTVNVAIMEPETIG